MKLVRVLGMTLSLAAAGLAGATAVRAQDADAAAETPTLTLDQVLERARQVSREVSAQNREREAAFRRDRARQQSNLNQAQTDLQTQERRSSQLEASFNENELEIERLDGQLRERQGEFAELFGAARQAAGETREVVRLSLVSGQFPGRQEPLEAVAQSRTLPTIPQLEELYLTMLGEMVEQSKTVTFATNVINLDGVPEARDVTRIGPFVAFTGGRFLSLQ